MSRFVVQIDATSLFYRSIILQPTPLGWLDSGQVLSVELDAGTYSVQVQSGVYTDFSFTVTAQGTVDFDAAFDTFASGRGTTQLTLSGFEVTIDARGLSSSAGVLFAEIPQPTQPWIRLQTIRLLPQSIYLLQQGSGVVCDLGFALGLDGRFHYNPDFDVSQGGCLSGVGTTTLGLHGFRVDIDVSAVSSLINLLSIWGFTPSFSGRTSIVVLPASGFILQLDHQITASAFTVGPHGEVNLSTLPDLRLEASVQNGVTKVQVLPPAPVATDDLSFSRYDFSSFEIVIGQNAAGFQYVSMQKAGSIVWVLDKRWLAGTPALAVTQKGKLNFSKRRPRVIPEPKPGPVQHGSLAVTLSGSRWPGTDVPADFNLLLTKTLTTDGLDIGVHVAWTFGGGSFDTDETFDGTAVAAVTVNGRIGPLGRDGAVTLPGPIAAQGRFQPGQLVLDAPQLAHVTVLGATQALVVNHLELTLMQPAERALFQGDGAPPLHSRLLLRAAGPWQVALPSLRTPVGDLSAQAPLFDTLLAELGENPDGRRRQALAFSAETTAPQYALALGAGISDASGAAVSVWLQHCLLSVDFDTTPPHLELHARALTAPMWTRSHGIGLVMGGPLDAVDNLQFAFDGDTVSVLRCDLPFSGISLPLPGCVVELVERPGLVSVLPPGSRPDGTRTRNWLVLGSPPNDIVPLSLREFAFGVLRPADLLCLRFEFRDLALQAGPGRVPSIVPAVAGQPGSFVVAFPPQHLAEQSFKLGASGDAGPTVPVSVRLAGESRLAFIVTADTPAQPVTLASLLAWPGHALSVEPVCDEPPPPSSPQAPAESGGNAVAQTSIELPYRLQLSPGSAATFSHASAPVTRDGWTSLWHTRLAARRATTALPGGYLADERGGSDNDAARRMRAVWSPDYGDGSTAPTRNLAFTYALSAKDRFDIVDNDANLANKTTVPEKLAVHGLMLSALGGSIHLDASWPSGPNSLAAWSHRSSFGRDEQVRVLRRGFLFPFGHRANRLTITERGFSGNNDNTAWLRSYDILEVTEPVKDFPERPDFLFTRIQIETLITGAIDASVRVTFPVRAWDRLGNLVTFDAAMFFLTEEDAANPATMNTIAAAYDTPVDGTRPAWVALAGQKLAFAPSAQAGDTTLEAHTLQFSSKAKGAATPDFGGGFPQGYVPHIVGAEVHLPAVRALSGGSGGSAAPVAIVFADDYLNATQPFPAGNPGEVFAELAQAIGVSFEGDKALGVASPNQSIGALSRRFGTAPADWRNHFPAPPPGVDLPADLKGFFPDSATLLGNIKIATLIEKLVPQPLAGADAPGVPSLKVDTHDPTQIVTTLNWQPTIDANASPIVAGVLQLVLNANARSTFRLDSKTVVPLKPTDAQGPIGTPDSVTHGQLTNFDLAFLPDGGDPKTDALATVHFAEFRFTAVPGQKPDVKLVFAGNALSLGGDLDFLQVLMEKLRDVLGAGPYVKIEGGSILAGYAIAIPQLSIGIFSLQNIAVGTSVTIPLVGAAPVVFRFNFAEAPHPFNLTIGLLGGGGYFSLAVDSGGIEAIDLAVEAGASVSLDLAGLASGSAHVMVGLSFHYGPGTLALGGYLRAGGELTVLQILSIHVEFYAGLTYVQKADGSKVIYGSVSVMVEVSIAFLSTSVTLQMEREFDVGSGPRQANALPLRLGAATEGAAIRVGDVMSDADWRLYAQAFA